MLNEDPVTTNEETITKPRLHGLPMIATSKYLSVHQEISPVTCDEVKLEYLSDYFLDANYGRLTNSTFSLTNLIVHLFSIALVFGGYFITL